MPSQPLTRTATVTLDSNGNGTAAIGPQLAAEVWSPESTAVSCTGNQPTPTAPAIATCSVFSNGVFVDSTYQVLGASSSMILGKVLYPGMEVSAVWSNCDPGQTATLTVFGSRKVP